MGPMSGLSFSAPGRGSLGIGKRDHALLVGLGVAGQAIRPLAFSPASKIALVASDCVFRSSCITASMPFLTGAGTWQLIVPANLRRSSMTGYETAFYIKLPIEYKS